jgi:hypothetical protein
MITEISIVGMKVEYRPFKTLVSPDTIGINNDVREYNLSIVRGGLAGIGVKEVRTISYHERSILEEYLPSYVSAPYFGTVELYDNGSANIFVKRKDDILGVIKILPD